MTGVTHGGSMSGATRRDIEMVEVPGASETYQPVPYPVLVEKLEDHIIDHMGVDRMDLVEEFGLARSGQQFFGRIEIPSRQVRGEGIAFIVRSSYDKSLGNAFGVGSKTYVCDNLRFSASWWVQIRKHTSNVLIDIDHLVASLVLRAQLAFTAYQDSRLKYESIRVDKFRGHELLGGFMGNYSTIRKPSGLGTRACLEAFRAWHDCQSDKTGVDRTLYGVMQALTFASKEAPIAHRVEIQDSIETFIAMEATDFQRQKKIDQQAFTKELEVAQSPYEN